MRTDVNPNDGGQDWGPMQFTMTLQKEGPVEVVGMARRCFGVVCPGVNDLPPIGMPGSNVPFNVAVVHLPTALMLVGVPNGARAYELVDALLGFPEFERPFDPARLMQRNDEVLAVIRGLGGVK
ncbi:MAG: hypothetical protein K9G48_12720 [Reyranella sp.]|nr:hypothetical protein [Reyranella sp.]